MKASQSRSIAKDEKGAILSRIGWHPWRKSGSSGTEDILTPHLARSPVVPCGVGKRRPCPGTRPPAMRVGPIGKRRDAHATGAAAVCGDRAGQGAAPAQTACGIAAGQGLAAPAARWYRLPDASSGRFPPRSILIADPTMHMLPTACCPLPRAYSKSKEEDSSGRIGLS
jgi:hypothetical protein